MSPPAIDANLIRRFRAARAAGLPAAAAYRQARTPELRYESCGDAAVQFLFDDPELAGFEVIATTTPPTNCSNSTSPPPTWSGPRPPVPGCPFPIDPIQPA